MDTNISKLKSILDSMGKCEFIYDESLKDYKLNGHEVIEIKEDFYLKLKKSFDEKIALQLVNRKVDEKLLKDLINKAKECFYHVKKKKENLRVSYLLDKSKNKLRESSDWTHSEMTSIMNAQLATLHSLNSFLIKLFKEFKYLIDDDFKNFKIENSLVSDAEKIEPFNKGKIEVKLTKKDTISLFLMLENVGVLDFSDTNRNKFIEQYFTYNHNNGNVLPLKDINSDISNLKDVSTFKARNINSFNRLKNKLIRLIDGFDYNELVKKIN